MKDPQPLSELLGRVLARFGVPDPVLWERITQAWLEVVPAPWNTQTRPISLRDGLLTVEVLDSRAQGVLKYGLNGLRQTLETHLGEGVVREIRLTATR